ncbi:MAG: hypothetical protein ACNS63_09705 [Candidatus Nitrospinota bacterium M3_3B_026]
MPEEPSPENEMEILSKAIVDAIVRSRDVRKAIARLSGSDEIDSKSFMVLMLKVGNLAEAMGFDVPPGGGDGAAKEGTNGEAGDKPDEQVKLPDSYEDGRRLSRAEKAFREYLSKVFDQDEWLRKNGLIY